MCMGEHRYIYICTRIYVYVYIHGGILWGDIWGCTVVYRYIGTYRDTLGSLGIYRGRRKNIETNYNRVLGLGTGAEGCWA